MSIRADHIQTATQATTTVANACFELATVRPAAAICTIARDCILPAGAREIRAAKAIVTNPLTPCI